MNLKIILLRENLIKIEKKCFKTLTHKLVNLKQWFSYTY